MTLPNFLIIGAAKSGTTAIYTYIKQHPQIFMSPRKELRFFSQITAPNPDVPPEYVHQGVATLAEYESYFEGVTSEIAIGESSPMYLYTPGTAERIQAVLPEVKLLAILRNPVARAHSAYTHGLREWKEPASSFREALSLEPERIAAGWGMLWHYRQAGFYFEQLSRYYRVFDPSQIKVVLHDDLIRDTDGLLRDVFTFLGVDPDFKPDVSARPNVSGYPRSRFAHQVMRRLFVDNNPIKWLSQRLVPAKMRKRVMVNLREANLEKRSLDPDLRRELQAVYREDIQNLANLIGRDLNHWLG